MKKKKENDKNVFAVLAQIQRQLEALNQKLDSFMAKPQRELARAPAVSKPIFKPQVQTSSSFRPAQKGLTNRRPMYTVICYQCGKDCEIPFKPTGNRPVYCKECFAKRKSRTPFVRDVKPAMALSSAVSFQQPASVSAQPWKAANKAAFPKRVKAKNKVAKKTAAKRTAAKKKKAVKRKGKKK